MKHPYKLFLAAAFALSCANLQAQSSCGNRDFDNANFTNWTGATGYNYLGMGQPQQWWGGIISTGNNASLNDTGAHHTILTNLFLDSMCYDPITQQLDTQMTSLAPGGGSASVRLGSSNVMSFCEKLEYAFAVTSTDTVFQYQFASVMSDGGHLPNEQAFFQVSYYDSSGAMITALTDAFYAADTAVPFIPSWNNPSIYYRRWTPISVNLSAYIGQTITVQFLNADCIYSGHFAYTYIDVSCFGGVINNVWPGDCDYDLQANNVDLLSLGYAYGSMGTARSGASNTWVAQPSTDWTQHFPLGANYKHSDCNGDGVVDLNDTTAILMNYGSTHPFRTAAPAVDLTTLPSLYLVPQVDTVGESSLVNVDVYAGSNSVPVNNLVGVAFTLNYDESLLTPATSGVSYAGSWMGVKNSTMITLNKELVGNNQTDIALCRTTQTAVNGNGYLGSFHFITTASVPTLTALPISISDIHAIGLNATEVPMNGQGTTVYIDPLSKITQTPSENIHFSLFPNPANDNLTVSTSGFTATKIRLVNALGQVVFEMQPTGEHTAMNTAKIAQGIYTMQVSTEQGTAQQRVVISH